MNHQDIKILISVYIDGEANSEEQKLVEDHCAICEECRKDLAQWKNISVSLKKDPLERLSPDVDIKLKARLGQLKERPMEKHASEIQWSLVGIFIALLTVSVLGVNQYAQRGLQGRLKSATDDIGDQYSPAYTSYRPVGSKDKSGQIEQLALAKTTQYEPYYLSSSPALDRSSSLDSRGNYEVKGIVTSVRSEEAGGFQLSSYNASTPMMAAARTYDDSTRDQGMEMNSSTGAQQIADSSTVREVQGFGAIQQANYNVDAPSYAVAQAKYESADVQEGRYNREEYDPIIYPVTPAQSQYESYDRIYENAFLNPVNAPLSTFSIDVDTASYSNVRRYLNQGQLPPPDAVRVEELVNYFSYDYPEPMWGQPFSITTEVAPCPWNPSHQLALIGLQGKRLNTMTMPASNLVFLIDVSGSMNQPNKLPLLQDAFRMMTQELEGKDKISIVVYAGAAGLVLDATPGNYKERISLAIDRLQAGGSTAGGDGIRLAYQVARNNLIANGNNRVILATDGDFNVGISNDDELVRMIESYRDQGIFLTVLGFGEGNLKDSKMEKLADHGNGNYFYIDNHSEARKVLVHELGSTLFAIAKDVKIQVEFNPATVKEYRLIGYENRMLAKEDFNDDTKDAGELGAGHTVTALYEIVPAYEVDREMVDPLVYQKQSNPNKGKSSDVMTVKLRYKEPKGEVSKLIKKVVSRHEVRLANQSDNLRFASAVAEFGLILRNSAYRGQASFDHVLSQARFSNLDSFGYRAEFIGLAEKARALAPYLSPRPVYDPVINHNEISDYSTGKGQK